MRMVWLERLANLADKQTQTDSQQDALQSARGVPNGLEANKVEVVLQYFSLYS